MLDDTFRSLAHERRRHLLVALMEESPRSAVRVPEDIETDGLDPDRVRIELIHKHLPLLEDVGFVRWDRENRRVSRGPNFEAIEPMLERLVERADPPVGD